MTGGSQRVVVTGASRGIGRAIASRLLAEGRRVALLARDRARLEELAKPHAGSALVVPVDLRMERDAEPALDRAIEGLGGIDALVNCAGIVRYTAVGGVGRDELVEQLAVNFVAPFMLAQRAAEHMIHQRQGGSILQISSTLATSPARTTAVYGCTKAALEAMTRSFALELGEHGVRVNAIAPGVVDTDMVRVRRPGGPADVEAQLETLRRLHPLGRLATPEDVARTASYLLGAEWVTGIVLAVDAGLLSARAL